jgi:hypothetical protein
MNLADGQWYLSGTFWTGAGVVVAVISSAALICVTWWTGNPKHRLLYAMPSVTPLLNHNPHVAEEIEVRLEGKILAHPHVVNIELTSRGRMDIPRSAFDGDKPICLNIGAPIIKCLSVKTSPEDRSEPPVKTYDSKLMIGPCLIGKRETISVSLLVDGPDPCLGHPAQSLVDVEICQRESSYEVPRAVSVAIFLAAATLLAMFASRAIELIHGMIRG